MKKTPHHPEQPIVLDERGTQRYLCNQIICDILEHKLPPDLNIISIRTNLGVYTLGDYLQFNQLIGYSLGGFAEVRASMKWGAK